MLELLNRIKNNNGGGITTDTTEFILDGIKGNCIYSYDYYESFEYNYITLCWNSVYIDIDLNNHMGRIKNLNKMDNSQIHELSDNFGNEIWDIINTGNYITL